MTTIQRLREQHNITREQLAARIGVSANVVGTWETLSNKPRASQAYRLSLCFGVPIKDIFADFTGMTCTQNIRNKGA